MRDADLPYEGLRDDSGIVLAIQGINIVASINFAASIVTLANLKAYAPQLVAAIRRWRLRDDRTPRILTVKGDGIDLTIDLPPNVGTQELLRQLAPLFDEQPD